MNDLTDDLLERLAEPKINKQTKWIKGLGFWIAHVEERLYNIQERQDRQMEDLKDLHKKVTKMQFMPYPPEVELLFGIEPKPKPPKQVKKNISKPKKDENDFGDSKKVENPPNG